MTTSPISPVNTLMGLVPGQAGQTTGQPGTPGSTADAFLALVQGLLGDATGQPAAEPGTDPVVTDGAPEQPALPPAPADTDAVDTDVATPLPDLAAAATAVIPVFAPQSIQIQQPAEGSGPAPAAPEASTSIAAVTSVASVAAATTAVAAPVAGAVAAPVAAAVAAEAPAAVKAPVAENRTTALPADAPAPTTGTGTKVELPEVAAPAVDPAPATTDQAPERAATPASAPASAPVATPAAAPAATPPQVAPISAVAPVATTASVAPATTDTQQVTQQVFPEVVRVVNNPNGPQRVTIKLNPEALGEVRVVLTSRKGGLEVSLAAGAEARHALSQGAPELQRLLDMVGRGDARIMVRDLAGTSVTQPVTSSSGSGLPNDLAGGAGNGTGRPGGEAATGQQSRNHSPAGSTSSATDGGQGTTNPSVPTESVARGQQGLDVTM